MKNFLSRHRSNISTPFVFRVKNLEMTAPVDTIKHKLTTFLKSLDAKTKGFDSIKEHLPKIENSSSESLRFEEIDGKKFFLFFLPNEKGNLGQAIVIYGDKKELGIFNSKPKYTKEQAHITFDDVKINLSSRQERDSLSKEIASDTMLT